MTPTELKLSCQDLGFSLTPAQTTSLHTYLTLLMQWNKVMNLVGPDSPVEILQTLIIDSLYLAKFIPKLKLQPQHSWDLGAGAGLPGLPLRCLWQEGNYWLVEAREKRALFLSTCLARCPLPNTQVFRGRVEQFMPKQPPANLILSRAFMPWLDLLELVKPYLASQGSSGSQGSGSSSQGSSSQGSGSQGSSSQGSSGSQGSGSQGSGSQGSSSQGSSSQGSSSQGSSSQGSSSQGSSSQGSSGSQGILILLLPNPLDSVPSSWEILEHSRYPVKTTQRAFTALRLK